MKPNFPVMYLVVSNDCFEDVLASLYFHKWVRQREGSLICLEALAFAHECCKNEDLYWDEVFFVLKMAAEHVNAIFLWMQEHKLPAVSHTSQVKCLSACPFFPLLEQFVFWSNERDYFSLQTAASELISWSGSILSVCSSLMSSLNWWKQYIFRSS